MAMMYAYRKPLPGQMVAKPQTLGPQAQPRAPLPTTMAGPAKPMASPNVSLSGPAPAPTNPMQPIFQQMLDQNSKMRGSLQDIGQRNIAALQRRNGANAAMSGMGMGSGYLSGQRSALMQGLNQMNQNLLGNDQQRMDILMRQASEQMADRRFQQGLDAQRTMRDESWARDDVKEGAAQSAERDQQAWGSQADRWLSQFRSVTGGDPNHSSHAWFIQMLEDYKRTGDPQIKSYLDNYLNPDDPTTRQGGNGDTKESLAQLLQSGQISQREYNQRMQAIS